MRYLDFDLEIGPGSGGSYPVTARSQAGQAHQTIRFPFDEHTLRERLKDLQIALLQSAASVRQVLSPEQQLVQDFGQKLFDAIISGEVRSRYDVCRQIANQETGEAGVRLRLNVQAPELTALPWEFLYDTRQGEYLCLSRFTPLVRYLDLAQPTKPLTVQSPLRILCMIANPSDQARLDIQREKQRISNALDTLETQGLVDLHWLPGQTWNDLHQAMWRGPWHIFHFIGHGGFNPAMQEGVLALVGEQGKTQLLSATQLTRLLADHRSLRLALLNACEGARSGEKDIFSSTAATLARSGIPAVLAMQHAITDRAAIQLTRTFYSALANGLPVDQAVAEVRKAITVDTPTTLEWGTPVLYMRSPDGVLFKLAAAKAPAPAVLPSTPQSAPTLTVPVVLPPPTSPPAATVFAAAPGKTKEQWVEEGNAYARTGRFQEAVAAYEAAIRLAPNFAPAHFGKGDTLRLLNRLNEALDALNQAIQLDPSLAVAYRRKGYVLNQLKRYQHALTALDKAIGLEPTYAASYVGKGEALTGLKRPKDALAAYEQAITRDPKLTGAYIGKANILLEQNQPQEALIAFHEALKLSPNNGDAHYGATLAEQRLLAVLPAPQPASTPPVPQAAPASPTPPAATIQPFPEPPNQPQQIAQQSAAPVVKSGISGKAVASLILGSIGFLWSTGFILAALFIGNSSHHSYSYGYSETFNPRNVFWFLANVFWFLAAGLIAILPGILAIHLGRKAKQAIRLSGGILRGNRLAQVGIVLSYFAYGIWIYKGLAALVRQLRRRAPPKDAS